MSEPYTSKPVVTEIADKVFAINCFNMVTPIVVVGEEKALLIDAGVGNYSLMQLIREEITTLPVEVALTHAHGDHVGSVPEFDVCYVPEQEIPMLMQYDTTYMQLFCDFYLDVVTAPDGTIGRFKDFPTKVLPWEGRMPKIIPLHDGDTIDLGGRVLTAYENPTHTKQDMSYVDSRTRILFAGDAIGEATGQYNSPINPPTYILSVEEIIRGLRNIQSHKQEFDRVAGGHLRPDLHTPDDLLLDADVIDRLLAVAEGVLSGSLPVTTYYNMVDGVRSFAEIGSTRLYFFRDYLRDADMQFVRERNS